jgi:hypothetical protein
MDHIRVNLTNIAIITISAMLGGGAVMFLLVYLNDRNIPVLSPAAHALLAVTTHFPAN